METDIGFYEFREQHKMSGGRWFNEDSIAYFRSQYYPETWKSNGHRAYFVSSEQFDKTAKRRYTVREADLKTYAVLTKGDFGDFATKAQARRFIKELFK